MQITSVDTDTGEIQEKRLVHREEAEKLYRALAAAGQKTVFGHIRSWSLITRAVRARHGHWPAPTVNLCHACLHDLRVVPAAESRHRAVWRQNHLVRGLL